MAFSGSNFIVSNNGECYLRMKLPDDGTTVINIPNKTITLWDIVCKVAEKKGYIPGDYIILAEKGSKKVKPDLSLSLENYIDYNLKLVSVEDKNEFITNNRKSSVMNSPASKKINFKMKKYNFPATIDEEQIKKKQQNNGSGSEFNLRIGKSKKSFSLFIFRRSSSTLMDSKLSNNSLQDEMGNEEHELYRQDSLNGENSSFASMNSIESPTTPAVDDIRIRESSLVDIDGKIEEHTSYHTIRKTIVSSNNMSNSNSTLRRNTFRKHQRSQTDNLSLKTRESYNSGVVYIIYSDGEKNDMQFPLEVTMDVILSCACKKKELNEETYTLQSENGEKIQLDRVLKYYLLDNNLKSGNINTFKLVEGEKFYSTVCVNENDQDVMILQYKNTYDEDLQVMAGTIDKLIERATDNSEKDDTFLDIFLLTYRAYIKPMEFFQLLTARFNCELPPDPTEDDIKYFEEMKGLIQSNVVKVMEYWVKHHWHDFAVYPDLEENLISFINELKPYEEYTQRVEDFECQIEIQKKKYEDMFGYIKTVEKFGKVMDSMLSELDPCIVAEQLCLYDFKLMKNIHPIEYLNQIWGNKENEDSPCLNFFISRFNLESFWAATEVLKEEDLKKRIEALKKIILVTKSCLDNNNFFSTFALMSGLSTNAVQRLKKTWEGLPSKVKSTFTEMEKLMDPSRNMRNYRMELESKEPPIIPFLPIYLKDLTFINDGNQSKVDNMINFDKLRMMSSRVHDLTSLTDKTYSFKEDPIIQNYLAKPTRIVDDKTLKEMSQKCEK